MIVVDEANAFDPEIVDALTAVVPDWKLCAA
jgi:hypothetical protein